MAGDQVDTDVPGSNPPGTLSATTGVLLYSGGHAGDHQSRTKPDRQ